MSGIEVDVDRWPVGNPRFTSVEAVQIDSGAEVRAVHYRGAGFEFSWSWPHYRELEEIEEALSGIRGEPENWEFFGPNRYNNLYDGNVAVVYDDQRYEIFTHEKEMDEEFLELIEQHYWIVTGRDPEGLDEVLDSIDREFDDLL